MKILSILYIILFLSAPAISSHQSIIIGEDSNELYFIGLHPSEWESCVLYYSPNCGEDIEIRDSANVAAYMDGLLLKDADSAAFYFDDFDGDKLLTRDNGYSWTIIDTTWESRQFLAAGVIPGEVYRRWEDQNHYLERSENYGLEFTQCSTSGFPDSSWIKSSALGIDSGEVYIWGHPGLLFYSADYAESFSYLGEYFIHHGVNPNTHIIKGADQGEIYIFNSESKGIWRISEYGANIEFLFENLQYLYWSGSIASTDNPGELYLLTIYRYMSPGGIINIFHTTDYFQTWVIYENIISSNSIPPITQSIPNNISLSIYPNPANPSFTIYYNLDKVQPVELGIYNMLGHQVWTCNPGAQNPGNYRLNYSGAGLSSGMYLVRIGMGDKSASKVITVVK